jgi:hypothetical protein
MNVKNAGKFVRKLFGNNILLRLLELAFVRLNKKRSKEIPPLFIIGAPRSGTTIIYQTLIKTFKFIYLSNIVNVFYGAPVFLSVFFRRNVLNNRFRDKNNYGYVKGVFSPSEAGVINELWFSKEKSKAKESISVISSISDTPMIFKNIHNTNRVESILKILPNALIVFVCREKIYNVQSIVLNTKSYNQVDKFISMGKYCDLEFDDYNDKAAFLVDYCDEIKSGLNKSYSENLIFSSYEDFCNSPQILIKSISEWYNKNKIDLEYYVDINEIKIHNKNKLV